jgi:hypothetical protein
MKGSLRILLALVTVVAIFAMTGCGAIVEQAVKGGVESATGVKVDDSGNGITIEGKDGSSLSSSNDGTLPEGFPEDFPVYENGTITTGIASDGPKGKGFLVGIGTDDSAGTAFDWYETQLKDKGWTIKTSMKTDGGGLLGGEKGTQSFSIAFGPGSGDQQKTNMNIALNPKP